MIVFTVTLSKVNNTGAAITFNLADLATGSATSAPTTPPSRAGP